MLQLDYWKKAAAFHGHECPGLAIGFKACEGAIAELGLDDSHLPALDEEIVCVTENDACCVDAIQALLGCTYGKANLVPRLRGKMAFSFFDRSNGKAVRLCLKPDCGAGMTREGYQAHLLETPYADLFDVVMPAYDAPGEARMFDSQICSACGEKTGEYGLRIQDGKPVCLDCYDAYDREGF